MFVRIFWLVLLSLVINIGQGQDLPNTEEEFEEQYQKNIRKSRINGVYIPTDINDAIDEIIRLSPLESLEKFKSAEEDTIARKLHFGLGRWMIVNWNFYDGSRLSHRLKLKGVSHPDDMAQFIIVTLHRQLNDRDLELSERAKHYALRRKDLRNKEKSSGEVIETQVKKIPK